MSLTRPSDISGQQVDKWSMILTKELRETLLLGELVSKDYDGAIGDTGDTVYVSQINAPTGENRTVGTDSDSFGTEQLSTTRVSVQANKRAVAAYEFEDLTFLQSQFDMENSELRQSLVFAMSKQINDYLYSLVAPSTSTPDHEIASVTDFNASELSAARVLAGEAKWMRNKPWYGLLSPQYYADVIDDTTLASADYGANDAPLIAGQLALPRMGFNLFEDTSRSGDYGLLFHPDFMLMVSQYQVRLKISDQHANKRFGFIMSADMVYGANLGIDGNVKHIRVQ